MNRVSRARVTGPRLECGVFREMRLRQCFRILTAAIPLVVALRSGLSAAQIDFEIAPGPRSMTAEEKALSEAPSRESDQGIILALDSERDDRGRGSSRLSVRLRARIFTNEGRGLGDMEIPYPTGAVLQQFWAWTLRPDGGIEELRREELREQFIAGSRGEHYQVLKGVLPGVSSGCVIEYGYILSEKGLSQRHQVDLQGDWQVRKRRYHWLPAPDLVASFRIVHGEGLDLKVDRDSRSILLTGKDLPAVSEEPLMPPLSDLRASVILYYSPATAMPKEFWTHVAKKEVQRAAIFARDKPLKSAMDGMGLPEGGGVGARVKAAHDWLASHIQVTDLMSAEEAELGSDDEPGLFAEDVLKSRRATRRQMDYLFMGFARVLGAEANRVLATDRRDHQFESAMLTTLQFDESLVAVHLPSDPPESLTLVDNVHGLPYGEVPWWIAGSRGFLADPKGGKTILLEPSLAAKNFTQSEVWISFDPGRGSAGVRWNRTDSGQAGLSDRLELRSLRPEERREMLEQLCGGGGLIEVTRAEAPHLEDLNQPLHLDCEGTFSGADVALEAGRFSSRIQGAWIEPVPELAAAVRLHPVVFPFPRLDRTVIEIAAPPGYATTAPPSVPPIDSPYGSYALFITQTPGGYHLERVFSLTAAEVPVSGYDLLRKFLAAVRQADQTTVEFRKTE
jgi:uncharacterized protein DUF3857